MSRNAESMPIPSLPWMQWKPGTRVVVRYRLADGLHDALGEVRETAPDHVIIYTKRGLVRVEASTMVTGKTVPPPPQIPTMMSREEIRQTYSTDTFTAQASHNHRNEDHR
ncbi:putative acetyltransferase [Schaalia sp. lx-100]|uniref:putative acetyltransferase n=1 Tax=Schaalia sp. lx-100 TaxID=2899081 RepID=UPI001E2CE1D4|nr:hypothetical protein [Schaalia sp. lx-100]MCD4556776.1 hypothetical protein [Schaalia sp. lx-100]